MAAPFVYPSSLWPSGFSSPNPPSGVLWGGEASGYQEIYPFAIPRIDASANAGISEYYVPYSAQLIWGSMSGIAEEYRKRGCESGSLPEFGVYLGPSGTNKTVLTEASGLIGMPLNSFGYIVEDLQNAISGLVCMSGYGDTFTDYFRRVFDYRSLLKSVPSGNRLQDNVSYYNIASGSTITINPLTRARAGTFPITAEESKYIGSQWGVNSDGSRNYNSDLWGASGIAVGDDGERSPVFQQYTTMGHFDWLVQSIMWRPPMLETFNNMDPSTFPNSGSYVALCNSRDRQDAFVHPNTTAVGEENFSEFNGLGNNTCHGFDQYGIMGGNIGGASGFPSGAPDDHFSAKTINVGEMTGIPYSEVMPAVLPSGGDFGNYVLGKCAMDIISPFLVANGGGDWSYHQAVGPFRGTRRGGEERHDYLPGVSVSQVASSGDGSGISVKMSAMRLVEKTITSSGTDSRNGAQIVSNTLSWVSKSMSSGWLYSSEMTAQTGTPSTSGNPAATMLGGSSEGNDTGFYSPASNIGIHAQATDTNDYHLPIGSGSSIFLDIEFDSLTAKTGFSNSSFGRSDFEGVHLCINTDRHFPNRIFNKSLDSNVMSPGMYVGGFSKNLGAPADRYEAVGFSFVCGDKYQGHKGEFGNSTTTTRSRPEAFKCTLNTSSNKPSEGFDEGYTLYEDFFAASGAVDTAGYTFFRTTPSTVKLYITKEGGYTETEDDAGTPWQHTTDAVWGDTAYAFPGDIPFIGRGAASGYGSDVGFQALDSSLGPYDNGISSLAAQSGSYPSGLHFSSFKISDFTPSGTVYEIPLFDKIEEDFSRVAALWPDFYLGASSEWYDTDGDAGPTASTGVELESVAPQISSNANWLRGWGGASPGYTAASGYSQFGSCSGFSAILGAISINHIGTFEDTLLTSQGYTLNSIRYGFPTILGPDDTF